MTSVLGMLQRFHECAAILADPTGRATAIERAQAQNIFLEFQKTKNPFALCRELLENTSDQYVLFQIGTCLKNGVIRDWESLGTEAGKQLLEYLFEYCHRKPLEHYVIAELMFAVALIIKRIIFYDSSRLHEDRELIERLCHYMKNISFSTVIRMNAAIAINLLLTELSTASNIDFAASWYTQLTTKIHFERHRLKHIYEALVSTLGEHLKLPVEQLKTADSGKFLYKLISNCELVLTWNFASNLESIMLGLHAHFFAFRQERLDRFQPPQDWIQLIIDGNVAFFFEVYLAFRSLGNDELVYKAMICLNQLSSLAGTDKLFGKEIRTRYVENFIQSVLRLISTIYEQISPKELVFFANIINNICAHFRTQCIIRYLNYELIRQFLDLVSKMTCKVMQTSLQFLNDEEVCEHYAQAISHLTNSWMIAAYSIQMVHGIAKSANDQDFTGFVTNEELQVWTRPIIDNFIRCHISEPEGFLTPATFENDNDINDFEENDNEKFKEQLATIGEVANISCEHTIETLNKLLLLKLDQFQMIVGSQNVPEDEKMKAWVQVCENIHWILMIATFVLHSSDDCDVPHSITLLCNENRWDLQRTQNALQNVDISQTEGVDPIIRFLTAVIKLINMEEYLLKNGGNQWISPAVSLTLSIFIGKFMNSYLMPMHFDLEEEDYVASVLTTVLDKHSDTANQLLGFFVDHMANKFLLMSSEHEVLNTSAGALFKFSRNKDRMNALRKSNTLKVLAQKFGQNEFPNCSNVLRKIIYQLFVTVYIEDLDFIIRPLVEQYKQFCVELNNSGNKEQIRNLFLIIADCSIGIANGVTSRTATECWSSYHVHVYNDLPRIMVEMHNYSNVVHTILNMMLQFSVMFVPFFSAQEDSIGFYNTSLAILKEYAKFNNGKASSDSLRLEELEDEFICILRFLQEISIRDIFFFDIFVSPSPSSLTEVVNNVIFTSIHILLPVMRLEMLQNEKLCCLYYKLLETLAADSDRFMSFPRDLFHSLIQSVHYAFKGSNVSIDVKSISLKIIIELCLQVRREPEKNAEILASLESFFTNVFEFIFSDLNYNSDKSVTNLVAIALYMLICCFPDTYQEKVRASMNIHDNPEVQMRIQTKLFEIVDEIGLDGTSNQNRLRFKTRFPDFAKLIIKELSLR